MNGSLILRILALLFICSGYCVLASAQATNSPIPPSKPSSGEGVDSQVPGDLTTTSIDREVVLRQNVHPHLGKIFWSLWVANLALTVASIELTENCVRSHQCDEGNPLLGKRPSRLELYGVRLGLLGAGFYVARKSKLDGSSAWKYMTAVVTTAFAADTAWDAYGTATHRGSQHSSVVANMPASEVEVISIKKSK